MTRTELWDMLVKLAKSSKEFPSEEEFAAYLKSNNSIIPVATIHKVYNLWVTEGKLTKRGNTFIFTDKNIQSEIMPVKFEPKPIAKPSVKSLPKKKTESQDNFILKVIKIVSSVIGTILTGVSIHFTFRFNKLGMNIFWGLMLSISVVCFMSFAFTIRSYVMKKSTRVFIVILWVLGISYSVFTAVSGQFNDFRKYSASDSSLRVESQNKIYEKQLSTLEKKQSELNHWRDQETEYSLNPDLKIENPVTWQKIQKGCEDLNNVESQIMEIQDKLLDNISEDVVLEETVYNWLASFLGVRADLIQFIIILFPALFIDLCSTVCFTFAFGKEEKSAL